MTSALEIFFGICIYASNANTWKAHGLMIKSYVNYLLVVIEIQRNAFASSSVR